MNGIVVYGTFHGSTKECAQKLAELTGFSITDAKTAANMDFSAYDKIIIGTALQKFKVHPDIEKLFEVKKASFAPNKTYFFYLGAASRLPKYFQTKLCDIRTTYLGGKIDWETLNISERIIISVISLFSGKKLRDFDNINENRIKKIATEIIGSN